MLTSAAGAPDGAPGDAALPADIIDRLDRSGDLSLSFNQEARLLLEMWSRRRGTAQRPMHLTLGVQLDGALNPAALEAALNDVVGRHEILRTAFAIPQGRAASAGDGQRARAPTQSIEATALSSLHSESVEGLEAGAQWRHVEHAAALDYDTPFDYARPPLMRARLIRLAPSSHVLVLTVHHLIADGWSLQILRRDLATRYAAIEAGRSHELSPLRVHYVDFARWQRACRDSGGFDPTIAYWTSRWSEYGSALVTIADLPLPRPGASCVDSCATASEAVSLGATLREQLRIHARSRRTTLHVVCLAAFIALLQRYTRKPRIAVWGQFANRLHLDVEHVVGWFANPHILGVDLSDDPTVLQVVERTRSVALEAYAHQELPLSLLLPTFMRQRRDDGGHAAFEKAAVQFDFRGERPSRLGESATMTPMVLSPGTSELGLQVIGADRGDDLMMRARFFERDVSRSDARSMLRDLQRVLQCLVTTPHAKVAGLGVPSGC